MQRQEPTPRTEWPAFDVERTSVRVVLLDAAGRLLLFRTIDPQMPEVGTWWELPGGGMEPGESVTATAVREVAEETGFRLLPEQVGAPSWERGSTYLRRHVRTLQHEHVVIARVPALAPVPGPEGRTPEELEDYVDHVWWTPAEVAAAGARGVRFFPGRLPELIAGFLAGETIHEPFEQWN